jgi:hypothetical protein
MSMRHWSFYQEETGEILDRHFSSTDDGQVPANTPSGFNCIEGHHDHLSKRVDVATGEVIDYQPPSPSADHEWNDATKRWQLSAAAQGVIDKRAAALSRIAQLEASQHRASRELSLGRPGALERLEAIDAEISLLRHDL